MSRLNPKPTQDAAPQAPNDASNSDNSIASPIGQVGRKTNSSSRQRRQFHFFRNRWTAAIFLLLLVYGGVIIYQANKPLPDGISFEGSRHMVPDSGLELLTDLTYEDDDGGKVTEQEIFGRMLQAIGKAEQFIVLDMFLYNGYYNEDQSFPALSRKITDALIAQKKKHPNLSVTVITDDVNTSYGSHPNADQELLKQAGIEVAVTDVDPLRDSNPLYTAGWRMTASWFGQEGSGWLPNKMATGAPDMTLRSYLKLLNAKANHRKVLVTETTLVVAGANAHDASFYNSNSGYAVTGSPALLAEALRTEQAGLDMSGSGIKLPKLVKDGSSVESDSGTTESGTTESGNTESGTTESGSSAASGAGVNAAANVAVQLLTEGRIQEHTLRDLRAAGKGDRVWMGMFYLADRKIIQELLAASDRGAQVKLILDPNEVAFGNSKIGVPNRPVAAELLEKSEDRIGIRWYNTDKEQYHTKLMLIAGADGSVVHNGSANFTTRNLEDLNLETNLRVEAPAGSKTALETEAYFERLWNNDGARFTLDYSEYEEKTEWLKRILYRMQDQLGFTTF
ncbi:phospholipase D-like domain-containing protein [Paenibacillus herberti]|uniref:phospholipase D n=1 Tax=Paenibacillus herberti TaxID=1619309 RepID=A0A229NX32_9BACL|nr:phospholipase D-like domain-containing protein [Paenibacillus herberti]OXM14361.1 phospholipase [Paenibacillus herberti]